MIYSWSNVINGNMAVYCNNIEELKLFLELCDIFNIKWDTGIKTTEGTFYYNIADYRDRVFVVKDSYLTLGSLIEYKNRNILPVSDFNTIDLSQLSTDFLCCDIDHKIIKLENKIQKLKYRKQKILQGVGKLNN